MDRIKLEISGDVQVDEAVTVVTAKSRARVPDAAAANSSPGRHIRERSVAVVVIQNIRAVVRDEKIGVSVVVVISRYATEAPSPSRDPCRLRNVGKGSVTIVAVQIIVPGMLDRLGLQVLNRGSVHQIQVHVSVLVVVE